ncbi:MAG: glycosyltransferase [Alphaproteobacteria bacterium]
MTQPIILLKGQSQYGALRLHVDQLARAFQALGQPTWIFDYATDGMDRLIRALNEGCRAVVSFNGIGLDVAVDDKPFYDVVQVPLLTLVVDHPAHHHKRLAAAGSRVVVDLIDRSHLAWLHDVFGADRFAIAGVLPPGGNIETAPADADADGFLARRDIALLFTGTYRGAPERPWSGLASAFVRRILDAAADLCLAHDMLPVEEGLRRALTALDVALAGPVRQQFWRLSAMLTDYVHSLRRHQALNVIGASGLPLSLYGRDWEPYLEAHPHVAYGGEGSFEETLHHLQRTRICLNTNTNFVAGAHERVFAAQLAGAAVCTDASAWYADHYADGEDILLYRWTRLDALPALLRSRLDDPAGLAAIALAGRARAEASHRWSHRAEVLLGQIDLHYGFGRSQPGH